VTDFAIANTGGGFDLDIVDGDLVLTAGISRAAEVAQRVTYRLMTWLGESPYQTTAGIPYEDVVFGFEPVPGTASLLVQVILDTEGVDGLAEDPVFVLGDDRQLSIAVAITVGEDTVPISLALDGGL